MGDKILIEEDGLIHQWRNVFRFNVMSRAILFDGSGFEYSAIIEKFGSRQVELRIEAKRKGLVRDREIFLFQSIIKKDNMEWVVEKATELGVSKITPVISERSEKKNINMQRLNKIAIEASEQSGRADLPEISSVASLEDCILSGAKGALVFDRAGSPIRGLSLSDFETIKVFIGPEGGWTDKELNLFKQKEFKIFSLGEFTLRAETAVIVALAKLL
jgi:16S rRNA (uracil1498-N3)-methyltransferase